MTWSLARADSASATWAPAVRNLDAAMDSLRAEISVGRQTPTGYGRRSERQRSDCED